VKAAIIGIHTLADYSVWLKDHQQPSMLKNIYGAPLGCADGDPGAPTINVKKYQRQPPGPLGGSDPYLGSERCVVNLHGYDRHIVILLTGLATLDLVLL
jgi:hypothetical protein